MGNQTLDLLCLLPCYPTFAPMKLLCEDLGVEQPALRKLLAELEKAGIDTVIRRKEGFHVAICKHSWLRAFEAGMEYAEHN